KIDFDIENYAYNMFGVNLMKIPGISHGTLLTMMSELGPGFVNKFPSASKFCRWCNLTPIDKITGGDLKSSNVPKRKNLVGQVFRQCTMALQKKDVPLGHYYRRIKSRLGAAQATVATAHKIAEIVYFMVLRQEEYREDVTAQNEKNAIVLKLANMEKRRKYLENKLAKIVGATISDG
ncbi:transposase, partial [uncultured Duncaniella sp.]